MKNNILSILSLLFIAILTVSVGTTQSFADDNEVIIDGLTISNPMIRATIPPHLVSAGYLKIKNEGSENDRLLSISSKFSERDEIHTMTMEDDVMKMRPLPDGIEIASGEEVILEPGGMHFMFLKVEEELAEGDIHPITLEFEQRGEVTVNFTVKEIKRKQHMKDKKHHHEMDHSKHH